MLRLILITAAFATVPLVSAQSLEEQLSNLKQAQDEIHLELAIEASEAQRLADEQAEQERLAQKALEAKARAKAAKQAELEHIRKEKLDQEKQLKHEEVQKDKQRDQAYQDELRQLELEERRLNIAEKKARVDRVNEYIDQELNKPKVNIDSH